MYKLDSKSDIFLRGNGMFLKLQLSWFMKIPEIGTSLYKGQNFILPMVSAIEGFHCTILTLFVPVWS